MFCCVSIRIGDSCDRAPLYHTALARILNGITHRRAWSAVARSQIANEPQRSRKPRRERDRTHSACPPQPRFCRTRIFCEFLISFTIFLFFSPRFILCVCYCLLLGVFSSLSRLGIGVRIWLVPRRRRCGIYFETSTLFCVCVWCILACVFDVVVVCVISCCGCLFYLLFMWEILRFFWCQVPGIVSSEWSEHKEPSSGEPAKVFLFRLSDLDLDWWTCDFQRVFFIFSFLL